MLAGVEQPLNKANQDIDTIQKGKCSSGPCEWPEILKHFFCIDILFEQLELTVYNCDTKSTPKQSSDS